MTTHPSRAETDDDEQQERTKPFYYIEQQIVRRVHHYYLSQIVEDASKYVEMIHQIQTAGEENIVWIHLNTPGGILDTGIQLINAMQASDAHIIASIEGEVASLGTMIFLAADEFVVHDNCLMMFHNYSGGVGGKGHEQIAALEAITKWTEDIMKRLYIPFMSESEFERIKKGEDLYFHSEEIRKRLKKMVKILEKEQKAKAALKTPAKARRVKKTT